MPKGIPKKKEDTPKPEATLNDVVFAIAQLKASVDTLAEEMKPQNMGVYNPSPQSTTFGTASPSEMVSTQTNPRDDDRKVPYEWRELVNTLLNKNFGCEIEGADGVSFQFSVIVPKQYSNASPQHWETYKEDRRSQVIPAALGANGVREWVTKIYENFPEETKSAIVYDRGQVGL